VRLASGERESRFLRAGGGTFVAKCEKGTKQQVLVLAVWAPQVLVQQINAAKG
jgi:hypothetical protein